MTVRYAFLHFLVDFCCALLIHGLTDGRADFYRCFLVYNFCAFALQMPAGLLVDRFGKSELTAYVGCIFTAVAGLFSTGIYALQSGYDGINSGMVFFLVCLSAIGNCLFHVGAGKEVLEESGKRLTPLGVFVAPGAAGIFGGPLLVGGKGIYLVGIYSLLLLAGLYYLLRSKKIYGEKSEKQKQAGGSEYFITGKGWICPAVFCLFVVVVLRSYMGLVSTFPFQEWRVGGVLSLLAVVLGKAAGGFFADKIGTGKTIVCFMCAASVGFLLAEIPVFGLMGVFFFNMSMPITLYLAADILNGYKGFAFGLLTFAIFIGFLPVYFGYGQGGRFFAVVISMVSLVLLYLGRSLGQKACGQEMCRHVRKGGD